MYYFLAGIALKIHYRIAKKRLKSNFGKWLMTNSYMLYITLLTKGRKYVK
jgi:hypothetical protein